MLWRICVAQVISKAKSLEYFLVVTGAIIFEEGDHDDDHAKSVAIEVRRNPVTWCN